MKKIMKKLLDKKGVKKVRKMNNNKGFSLIELLIVIAIMGVLAVIAFNMFGGVLSNSKKKADDQQARNLEKAILTYCIDSGDWKLEDGKATNVTSLKADPDSLIKGLLQEVTLDSTSEKYGPVLTPKYPEDNDATSDRNVKAFAPQWNTASGGEYKGWQIDVYPAMQTVKVVPTTSGAAIKVH